MNGYPMTDKDLSPAFTGKPVILIHLTVTSEPDSPAACADIVPTMGEDTDHPRVPRVMCPACYAWAVKQPRVGGMPNTITAEDAAAWNAQRLRDAANPLEYGYDQQTWDEFPDEVKDTIIAGDV